MKYSFSLLSLLFCGSITTASVFAGNAIDHAPIGVMEDHIHKQGEVMFSYRAMLMKMDKVLAGTDEIGENSYSGMTIPLEMDMSMHMLGAMYGLTDTLTLMAMGRYLTTDMDLKNRMSSQTFNAEAKGLGDASVSLLYGLHDSKSINAILFGGISIPTGDITKQDDILMMGKTQLPYPMQLGSGTWDPYFGGTLIWKATSHLRFGSQFRYRFRLGRNSQGYDLGESLESNLWSAYELNSRWSLSLRIQADWKDQIEGRAKDLKITGAMNPVADPSHVGGTTLQGFAGLNFLANPESTENALRFGLEFGSINHQVLNGPQMGIDWTAVLGAQLTL